MPILTLQVLPFLGPSGSSRRADDGAESLGAHVEGPFLNPTKNGVHNRAVLRVASSFADLEDMYGITNITPPSFQATPPSPNSTTSASTPTTPTSFPSSEIPIKMITVAPELGSMTDLIPELTSRGILVSIGHSEATYEEASTAVSAGATMITHLFNAMRPLHHRDPGIFGVLGATEPQPQPQQQPHQLEPRQQQPQKRPYFGLIADGIHLHPATVKIAWHAHPAGLVLVTDAMHMVGLPDGRYEWTNGEGEHFIVKRGSVLELEGTGVIAGRLVLFFFLLLLLLGFAFALPGITFVSCPFLS
jgi:N-acetylglucosamine-6-phosphate deacetylase